MKQNRIEERVYQWLRQNNDPTPQQTVDRFAEWSGYRPPGAAYRHRRPSPQREARWKAEWAARHAAEFQYFFAMQRIGPRTEGGTPTGEDLLAGLRRP